VKTQYLFWGGCGCVWTCSSAHEYNHTNPCIVEK